MTEPAILARKHPASLTVLEIQVAAPRGPWSPPLSFGEPANLALEVVANLGLDAVLPPLCHPLGHLGVRTSVADRGGSACTRWCDRRRAVPRDYACAVGNSEHGVLPLFRRSAGVGRIYGA